MYFKEVSVPEEVKVEINGNEVRVSGPKGELKREFDLTDGIKIEKIEKKVRVSAESERRKIKARVGTIAAHLRNMIKGVTQGFTYRLKIVYAHFPITVKVEGDKVLIQNFLGERVPRVAKIVGNTQVKVEKDEVVVSGINIEDVGQTAANIEQACRIKGRDRKIFQDGIWIVGRE